MNKNIVKKTKHSDETKNEIDDVEEDDVTGHDEYNEDHTEITTTYTPLLLMHESSLQITTEKDDSCFVEIFLQVNYSWYLKKIIIICTVKPNHKLT